jgi:hypothetical protein
MKLDFVKLEKTEMTGSSNKNTYRSDWVTLTFTSTEEGRHGVELDALEKEAVIRLDAIEKAIAEIADDDAASGLARPDVRLALIGLVLDRGKVPVGGHPSILSRVYLQDLRQEARSAGSSQALRDYRDHLDSQMK